MKRSAILPRVNGRGHYQAGRRPCVTSAEIDFLAEKFDFASGKIEFADQKVEFLSR